MNAPNRLQALVLRQIEAAMNVLRPLYGLGPVTVADEVVGAPLIAASDPVHPSVLGFFRDGRVCLQVDWVIAVHDFTELACRLIGERPNRRFTELLFGLASILSTNRSERRSYAGWDAGTGCVFVLDSFVPNRDELLHLTDRVRSVIEHAREIRSFPWRTLDLPDAPESSLKNSYLDV